MTEVCARICVEACCCSLARRSLGGRAHNSGLGFRAEVLKKKVSGLEFRG